MANEVITCKPRNVPVSLRLRVEQSHWLVLKASALSTGPTLTLDHGIQVASDFGCARSPEPLIQGIWWDLEEH